jgi:hypothetical protein
MSPRERLEKAFEPWRESEPTESPKNVFVPSKPPSVASDGVGTYPSSDPRSTSSAAAAALRKRIASPGASSIASSSTGAPPRALFAALAEPPRLDGFSNPRAPPPRTSTPDPARERRPSKKPCLGPC